MNGIAGILLRRLLLVIPVVWAVVTLVFLLLHLVPGDPVLAFLGETATPEQVAEMRRRFGLDRPLLEQYANYWKQVLQGDLGVTFVDRRPVAEKILSRYPATLQLAVAALLVAVLIAIPLGVTAARHHGGVRDAAASIVALLGIALPNFALGPLLILLFSVKLQLLPPSGFGDPAHLVLPAFTLGAALAAILTRLVRTSVLEELRQDYVKTARAKGLDERTVIYRHVLRNGLIPVVTIVGLQFGVLLGGAIITERIFNWPGIGTLTIEAIAARDYPLVQGCLLVISLTYIFVNTATDLLYRVLDPRIKVE
ncbi:MAG: ABC transporter permease [Blastocatellia bacterium]|nr:ABC transporter permease [Blastocatellia bacterium]MCS7156576.1 ABC transporter permease [Blastocatellia bacterium]MCX7751683.1 ABC transporter permease [Blastocatellia bacterium]MDW8168784.1 ABC transporter permease [Acidobacteriota bacterium]MDW8255677.1 ABC transporter permease [Acidobacteriota bacterium]